jgi:hypothetical protein
MEGHECGLLATSYSAATLFLESQRYGAFDSTGDWGREINPQDTDHQSKTHECVLHSVPQAPERLRSTGAWHSPDIRTSSLTAATRVLRLSSGFVSTQNGS